MNIKLDTLGCKLNQAETELLAGRLTDSGHSLVNSVDSADIYILNTCTVTHTADAKSRQLLRQAHRKNPGALIVAAGCYAQRSPEELSLIDGVGLVTGNDKKMYLSENLLEGMSYSGIPKPGKDKATSGVHDVFRTRAFIKIQDGCSNFCSYCIVPFVRGKERSLSPDRIIENVKFRISGGVKEIVLTGTEIGSYNSDGADLAGLIRRVLSETGVTRLRLSSLQPDEITPELIGLWEGARLCPHFHLSLQSGSDSVLERMNRRYRVSDYSQAVSLIRSRIPDAAITTDIIAGFPGETGKEYEESIEVCRETGFSRMHIFPFSKRQETAAARMSGQVRDSVKTQRSRKLGTLGTESAESYCSSFTGRIMDVLWEQRSGGVWSGHTGNYIKVYTKSGGKLANTITPVKLEKPYKDGMWGETVT